MLKMKETMKMFYIIKIQASNDVLLLNDVKIKYPNMYITNFNG
jgi:hypothetical protein